ncbi:MAG: nitroreductase [Calothrix sp. SM1_5_4]|nr:nitroreductase [Calothrix sp. SM1_5_4]
MDLRELILTRRTVHSYRPEPVADALVTEALALSLWAPNHKLTYPWIYTWIGPVARGRLAELAVSLKSAKEGALGAVKEKAVREALLNPAHLIALGVRRSNAFGEHEDYATLSCSVQIASQFLWSRGVASKWSTAGWSTHADTYSIWV